MEGRFALGNAMLRSAYVKIADQPADQRHLANV